MSTELEAIARPRPSGGVARELWDIAAQVVDPEVPVLSIADLGVLRAARLEGERPVVEITPTYTGCPAVEAIRADVVSALAAAGWPGARVDVVVSPAWTTDWMSAEGRAKLSEYGITPPCDSGCVLVGRARVDCPRCGSEDVSLVSRFGSTACKALYSCASCQEPFEHFKTF